MSVQINGYVGMPTPRWQMGKGTVRVFLLPYHGPKPTTGQSFEKNSSRYLLIYSIVNCNSKNSPFNNCVHATLIRFSGS